MKKLSPVCAQVVILDFTEQKIVKYADVATPETPGLFRIPKGDAHWYLAHFHDGTTRSFSSQFPVHHLPPSLLEKMHRTARHMPLAMLSDLYASVLDMPRRRKEVQHAA